MYSTLPISLFLLALWSPTSLGIITVDQSPPVISVQPQDTVNILCRASRDIGNDMELYQLKPGQTPKLLIHDSTVRMSGVPGRFSGTLSGALTTFTISGVQLEDEAEYQCAQSEEYPLMFGQGTKLIVKGRSLSSPVVSLLLDRPPAPKQPTPDQVSVVCEVKNFYPDHATVSWSVDGRDVSDDKKDTKSVRSSDGTYSMSSILSMARSAWETAQDFTCQVQHESLKTPASHSVSKSQCKE